MNPFYAQQLLQDEPVPQEPVYAGGMPRQGNPLSTSILPQEQAMNPLPMQILPGQHISQPVNPLASGVSSAIDSARLSLQMRADQKQQFSEILSLFYFSLLPNSLCKKP